MELRPERRFYRQILQALTATLLNGDQLRVEVAVSRVLGVIWCADPGRDGGAEEAFGRGLVDFLRQGGEIARQGSQAVANLLRVLAVTATVREVREAARQALAVRPWPPSGWSPEVGEVSIGRCWVAEDAFGDHATVLCEYGYRANARGQISRPAQSAPRHGVAVHVDRVAQGAAVDVSLVEDVDAAELELRLGADHADDEFRRVEPGWAGAVLEQAFARTDLLASTPVQASFAPLRALALARVRALPVATVGLVNGPEASPGHREAIVAEFCESPEVTALLAPESVATPAPEPDLGSPPVELVALALVERVGPDLGSAVALALVERVARLLVEFAARIDPTDLLRVSPGRVEAFLFDWLPAATRGSKPEPAEVVAVVRAWSAWAARQGGTPLLTRDALARSVEEILEEYQHGH